MIHQGGQDLSPLSESPMITAQPMFKRFNGHYGEIQDCTISENEISLSLPMV